MVSILHRQIIKTHFKREMGYSGVEWSKQDEIWNEMKKNNFSVLEDTKGYDQYIWVSSKSLNINADAIAIDSDMTKGRMKNAFVKQRQGKFGNKVMLAESKLAEFLCPKTVMTGCNNHVSAWTTADGTKALYWTYVNYLP